MTTEEFFVRFAETLGPHRAGEAAVIAALYDVEDVVVNADGTITIKIAQDAGE